MQSQRARNKVEILVVEWIESLNLYIYISKSFALVSKMDAQEKGENHIAQII